MDRTQLVSEGSHTSGHLTLASGGMDVGVIVGAVAFKQCSSLDEIAQPLTSDTHVGTVIISSHYSFLGSGVGRTWEEGISSHWQVFGELPDFNCR